MKCFVIVTVNINKKENDFPTKMTDSSMILLFLESINW